MKRTFVIVRHGNTFAEGETPRRIGACTDLPLVASGRSQARRLGAWFASQEKAVTRILTSPLRRTRETAEIIRSTLPVAPPLDVSDLLAEIDHGPDENQPEEVVIRRIGRAALAAWDSLGTAPPGWTSDSQARIVGWQTLFDHDTNDTTLLVTSNGAARFALLADAQLREQATARPSLKLRTGAFGVIEADALGKRLLCWNCLP
ncbi:MULTISPECIES: histidine phosphatase family protein [unclassified Sphingomonas]|uniref:histidine phosphatase family protein n=1 Tax=unclassified Sphingomonas TaxID=196159 RepID=UPI0028649F1D|nr:MULTISPECIES: histidine phosphatase family protein [unclassified Sphingomonas]MDR6116744.1 broad specificity phosphatase PhoE [Sphingomonas sp. SORGH_AS_0789]MDR6151816.1 broad specificity phosphatase PhoE [Sphingomonas sp. SORGH_AS_0742]